ncbi:hypothetical protein APSETT444_006826 [Aspergillus pseudonomiae]
MLNKLREKLCCGCKERRDDTEENFRPADLSQKGKDRVASVGGHSREDSKKVGADQPVNDTKHVNDELIQKYSKTQNPEQQDETKCLGESEHDEESDHKQDKFEIPKCPVSDMTPADDDVIDRSDSPGDADLWQRAFDELNEDSKGELREDQAMSPENAIEEVVIRTKESFEAYQNGGLKFKKYNGEEVNVREVAKRILDSVIHCSEIIKGIAAFDPTHHDK